MSAPAHASDPAHARYIPPPPLVAVAGWVLPGLGYWLIGHHARALTIGITIIILFMSGVLLGGVRSLQVPGYGENGGRLYILDPSERPRSSQRSAVEIVEHRPGAVPPSGRWIASDFRALLAEIGNKPWSICQVMAGPMAIANGAWSISASRTVPQSDGTVGPPAGALSHSRINEIAVLYMAVAGMLNLLAIIDSAGRADDALAQSTGQRSTLFAALLHLVRYGTGRASRGGIR